jgi:hypothetical protein
MFPSRSGLSDVTSATTLKRYWRFCPDRALDLASLLLFPNKSLVQRYLLDVSL